MVSFLIPLDTELTEIVAPLIAWIFVGERMTWLMGLGILLIMGGVIVMQRARGTKQNER